VQIVREYQGTPRVRAQKHKLLQILVNLLRNARDAVDAGESTNPRIVMRLSTHPDGEFVRIEIQDNGVGIDPDNVVAIFGSGFTTKAGGHGLGLHSSANLAIQMGGRLTAHSEGLGKGSTFVLELPLEEQRVAA
jgi:signal transduction histidine kinase